MEEELVVIYNEAAAVIRAALLDDGNPREPTAVARPRLDAALKTCRISVFATC